MLKLLKIQKITPSQREALSELLTKKVDQYSPSITFLTKTQKDKFEKRCLEENIHKSYEINVNYKYKNDKNKIFFLIYLTKEKAKENIKALKNEKKYVIKFSGLHFKKVCRETLNNNYKFKHVFDDIMQSQGDDNPPTYFPPRDNYWSMPLSNELNFFKQPTQKTITINDRRKRSNKNKDFIKNLNIKDKIDNYYPKLIYLSKKVLKNYLSKVKKIIKAEKIFGEKKLVKNKKLFMLGFVSLINFDKSKGFIFYLTKKQIKNLEETRKQGFFYGKMSLFFTTNQLLKTYKEVLKINSYLYYYKDIDRFKNKNSVKPKLLAISDKPFNKEEQINSVNVLDLIDFGYQETNLMDVIDGKDLIEFRDDDTIINLNNIINKKMSRYYKYGVNLTKGQKTRLSEAIRDKTEITLRLKLLQLVGPDELMLTQSQISKIKKSIVNDKGLDLKISKSQISKLKRPGLKHVLDIDVNKPLKTKTKTKTKTKDLIDFSDNDLIDFSDNDLIDLNTILPNPKPTTKDLREAIKNLTDIVNTLLFILKKNNIM